MSGRRAVVARVVVLLVAFALVATGAGLLYSFTLPPPSYVAPGASAPSPWTKIGSLAGASGSQITTVEYNGTTFQITRYLNAPQFSCPPGTDPKFCELLELSCGTGGEYPWENCYNCPFDRGCTGAQTCDPYTHQCAVRASACQVAVYAEQQ